MDVRILRRRLGRVEPPRARGGRRPRDGTPQLRDHGAALGRVGGADRNRDEREAEGCLLPHAGEGGMGTGRDLRRGPGRRDRGTEGSGRRRNGPGPRRPRLRQVADPPGPRRRVPVDHRPDRDRRGPEPVRRAGRTPEVRCPRGGTLPEWSPRADPGAEALRHSCPARRPPRYRLSVIFERSFLRPPEASREVTSAIATARRTRLSAFLPFAVSLTGNRAVLPDSIE